MKERGSTKKVLLSNFQKKGVGPQNFQKNKCLPKCRKLYETSRKHVFKIWPNNQNFQKGGSGGPKFSKKKNLGQNVGNCMKHRENKTPKIDLRTEKNLFIFMTSILRDMTSSLIV